MSDEMEEIITEFITEAEETLERIDPMFVELETRGYDKDLLNEIFRGMHTLKGAAGFLGFQHIVDIAHRAESIMKKLRDGETNPTPELMDVILKSVDGLRLHLSHIRLKDGIEENMSALLGELDAALETVLQGGEGAAEPMKPAPAAEEPAAIEETPVAQEHAAPEPQPEPQPEPEPKPKAPPPSVPLRRLPLRNTSSKSSRIRKKKLYRP